MNLNNIYAGADTFSSRNVTFRDYEKYPFGSLGDSKLKVEQPLFYTVPESENATYYDSRLCKICARQIKIKPAFQIATISQKVFEAENDDSCYGHKADGESWYVNKMFVGDDNIEH